MTFIEAIKEKAKQSIKTIILPESEDLRVLEGASKVLKEGFAKIILIGNEEEVRKRANENSIDLAGATIIDPKTSEKYEEYVKQFYELRKTKGITLEKAKEILNKMNLPENTRGETLRMEQFAQISNMLWEE